MRSPGPIARLSFVLLLLLGMLAEGGGAALAAPTTPEPQLQLPPTPRREDDPTLLARLLRAVAACPRMSISTVPFDWQMSLVTANGCAVHHPPAWLPVAQPGVFKVAAPPAEHTGWLILGTYLPGTYWNDETLADFTVHELTKLHPDLAVIHASTQTDPWGLGVRIRHVVVKLTQDGVPSIGVVKVIHAQCSAILNNCALTAMVSWTTTAELRTWTCPLGQIEATFRCPSGGGSDCRDPDCHASCRADGNAGGRCVGDTCSCF